MFGNSNVLPMLRNDSLHSGISGVNRFLEIAETANDLDLPVQLQPFSPAEIAALRKELQRRSALDRTKAAERIERSSRNYRVIEP